MVDLALHHIHGTDKSHHHRRRHQVWIVTSSPQSVQELYTLLLQQQQQQHPRNGDGTTSAPSVPKTTKARQDHVQDNDNNNNNHVGVDAVSSQTVPPPIWIGLPQDMISYFQKQQQQQQQQKQDSSATATRHTHNNDNNKDNIHSSSFTTTAAASATTVSAPAMSQRATATLPSTDDDCHKNEEDNNNDKDKDDVLCILNHGIGLRGKMQRDMKRVEQQYAKRHGRHSWIRFVTPPPPQQQQQRQQERSAAVPLSLTALPMPWEPSRPGLETKDKRLLRVSNPTRTRLPHGGHSYTAPFTTSPQNHGRHPSTKHRQQQPHETPQTTTATETSPSTTLQALDTTTTAVRPVQVQVLPEDQMLWGTVQILLHLLTTNRGSFPATNHKDKIVVVFSTLEQKTWFARLFQFHLAARVLEWPSSMSPEWAKEPADHFVRRRQFVHQCFVQDVTTSPAVLFIAASDLQEFWNNHQSSVPSTAGHNHSNSTKTIRTHVVQVGLTTTDRRAGSFLFDHLCFAKETSHNEMMPRDVTGLWILTEWEESLLANHFESVGQTKPKWIPQESFSRPGEKNDSTTPVPNNPETMVGYGALDPLVEEIQMQLLSQFQSMSSSSSIAANSGRQELTVLQELHQAARSMALSMLADSRVTMRSLKIMRERPLTVPEEAEEKLIKTHQQQHEAETEEDTQEQTLVEHVMDTWVHPLGLPDPLLTLTRLEAKRYQLQSFSSSSSSTIGEPSTSLDTKRPVWKFGKSFDVGKRSSNFRGIKT